MIFEFEGFRLDPAQRRLSSPDGSAVDLPSRSFDLLLYMVERPGEMLDKSALLKAVWPNTVVEENNLSQCIFLVRRALGEQAGQSRFIATIPGRGYQFVARVQTGGVEAPSPVFREESANSRVRSSTRAWALGAAGAILLLVLGYWLWADRTTASATGGRDARSPPLKSIAVLPFADLTPDKDMEYFGDGLAEELTSTLGKLQGLQVVSRRSAFMFKDKNEDIRKISAALNVESILEGSVRRDGGQLRISAQLSRARDGYSLWSETYARKSDDLLGVQGDIAREVARALNPLFATGEPISSRVRTQNPEAYASYLRGVFAFGKLDLERAREEFLRATKLDPQFAMAFAQLARCYDVSTSAGGENTSALRTQADMAIARALEIDPSLEDIWWIYSLRKRVGMGETAITALLERTVAADSSDADAMLDLARTYALFGRRDESLAMLERAYHADPMWAGTIYALAYFSYSFKGDRQRFVELVEALERLDPTSTGPLHMRTDLAFFEGRPLDWDGYLAQLVQRNPRNPEIHAYLAKEYSDIGLTDAASYHYELATKLPRLNPYIARTLAHIRLDSSGDIAEAKRIVDAVIERQPEDTYALRAQAELRYFQGDCKGSVDSLVRSDRSLGSAQAIDIVGSSVIDWQVIPWLLWCTGQLGDLDRQADIARAWDAAFRPPSTPDVSAYRARAFAARGDRKGLIEELRMLANGKAPAPPFSRFEPMIQPYLKDPEVARLLAILNARCAEWRRILPKSSMRVQIPAAPAAANAPN